MACLSQKLTSTLNKDRLTSGNVEVSSDKDRIGTGQGLKDCFPRAPSVLKGPLPDRRLSNSSQPLEFPDNKCLKFPADGTYESKSYGQRAPSPKSGESLSLSATSDRNNRACQPSNPPNFGNTVPTRPSTATGVVPPRPSSPKSRTASRSGCHRRHRSEAEQRETGPVFECLEFLLPQSRSVSAQYQDHRSSLIKEITKSPISRGATRLGRQLNLDQGFVERALEFNLSSMPIDSRDVALAVNSYRRRADILAKDHDSFFFSTHECKDIFRDQGNVSSPNRLKA